MKTTIVESAERGRSPLGAHIRFLMDGPHGNMIHSTVPPEMVGRACRFRTIDEYWYVLSGEGKIWRRAPDGSESITLLIPGVCIDIPLGTAFQYRCTGDVPPCLHLHGPATLAGRRRGRDRGRAVGTPCGMSLARHGSDQAPRPA
ncbi:MAG TPA: hypothetical protein VH650_10550 [Gaiellaceae bacterium]